MTYYTAPTQQLGTTNPLVAGGLRASMNEYAKLLALVYHRGRYVDLENDLKPLIETALGN